METPPREGARPATRATEREMKSAAAISQIATAGPPDLGDAARLVTLGTNRNRLRRRVALLGDQPRSCDPARDIGNRAQRRDLGRVVQDTGGTGRSRPVVEVDDHDAEIPVDADSPARKDGRVTAPLVNPHISSHPPLSCDAPACRPRRCVPNASSPPPLAHGACVRAMAGSTAT